MEITESIVKKIANLSKLHLSETELKEQQSKLTTILEWVEQLSNIDTDNIEPLAHPLEGKTQPQRKDEVTEVDERDLLIQLTNSREAGLYLVPKVIK